uniref:Uncharacterized protein n=1 Tax=Sarcophilus harrisii TaxID=9305 RepID=A0A7N4V4Y9_SARHA
YIQSGYQRPNFGKGTRLIVNS